MQRITELQIVPIKPANGLVAFASFVLDDCLYLGSIGIVTRPQGGYRLVYPCRQTGDRSLNIFHPIKKEFAQTIENEVIKRYEDVVNHDRHNSLSP